MLVIKRENEQPCYKKAACKAFPSWSRACFWIFGKKNCFPKACEIVAGRLWRRGARLQLGHRTARAAEHRIVVCFTIFLPHLDSDPIPTLMSQFINRFTFFYTKFNFLGSLKNYFYCDLLYHIIYFSYNITFFIFVSKNDMLLGTEGVEYIDSYFFQINIRLQSLYLIVLDSYSKLSTMVILYHKYLILLLLIRGLKGCTVYKTR
jgi:hypothetical protein